jgi:hypothetical protein
MLKKILLFIIIFIFNLNYLCSEEYRIIAKVDNEIITNIDIVNQGKYLIIFNPSLKNLDKKELNKFEIESLQPETLYIKGLSSFLSAIKLDVKVVNKDVVLFKRVDKGSSYSESGIIDRKTGELVHEVTKNIKSENSEKDITFYSCSKLREKV